VYSLQKSNFISSDRFITRGAENKKAKKKEGQTPFDKAGEEKKEAEKI
jgi:hypothetical protein